METWGRKGAFGSSDFGTRVDSTIVRCVEKSGCEAELIDLSDVNLARKLVCHSCRFDWYVFINCFEDLLVSLISVLGDVQLEVLMCTWERLQFSAD